MTTARDLMTAGAECVGRDAQRAVDRGQPVGKNGIEDDAFDLDDRADVRAVFGCSHTVLKEGARSACARY